MRPGSPGTGPAGGAVGALAYRPQGPKAGRRVGSRVGDNFIDGKERRRGGGLALRAEGRGGRGADMAGEALSGRDNSVARGSIPFTD